MGTDQRWTNLNSPHAFGHSDGHLPVAKTAVEKAGPSLVGEHVTPNN